MNPEIPHDKNNRSINLVPRSTALASTLSSSINSATTITLNANTSIIEVQAISQGVYLKYAAGVSASNNGFDEHIMADTTRHFVIPPGVTVISVIEETATATVIVIEK